MGHGPQDHHAIQDWALIRLISNCERSHTGRAAGAVAAQAAAVHQGLCCAVSAFGGSRSLCDCQSCKVEVCISHAGPLHFQSEATPRECSRLHGLAESHQMVELQNSRQSFSRSGALQCYHQSSSPGLPLTAWTATYSCCRRTPASATMPASFICLTSQATCRAYSAAQKVHSDNPVGKVQGFGCSPTSGMASEMAWPERHFCHPSSRRARQMLDHGQHLVQATTSHIWAISKCLQAVVSLTLT